MIETLETVKETLDVIEIQEITKNLVNKEMLNYFKSHDVMALLFDKRMMTIFLF